MPPRASKLSTIEEEQTQQQPRQQLHHNQEQQQARQQNSFVSGSRNGGHGDQACSAERSPSEDSTASEDDGAGEHLAGIRRDATEYMEQFGLAAFFQNMMQRVITERPENPFKFMLEFLHAGGAVPSETSFAGMNTVNEEMHRQLAAVVVERDQLLLRNFELEQQLADATLIQQRSSKDAKELGKGNEVHQLLEQRLAQRRNQLVELQQKVLQSESRAQNSLSQLATFKQQLEAALASVAAHTVKFQHMEQKLHDAEERATALSIDIGERSSEKNFLRELQYQEQLAEMQAQLQVHRRKMVELERLTKVAVKRHTGMSVSDSEAQTQRGDVDMAVLEARTREAEAKHADVVETLKTFEFLLTGSSLH